MSHDRIKQFRSRFKAWGISHFLVTNPSDIYYFSGFRGDDSTLLIGPRRAAIYTDGRYTAEVARMSDLPCIDTMAKLIDPRDETLKVKGGILGFDPSHLSHQHFLLLKKGVKASSLKKVDQPTLDLRIRKDASEIKLMQKASDIAAKAFLQTCTKVKPGMTEVEVAAHLEFSMKQLGGEGPSFDIIAAAGPNAALPHAVPGPRKVPKTGVLLMDFGVRYNGYDSDQTRMVTFGKVSKQQQFIMNLVGESYNAAVAVARSGVSCKDVDAAAREVIVDAGYGPLFKHGTGHGVGIDIHEAPGVSYRSLAILEEGMVITIEPGIYLDGKFGVRLENMFLVTKTGVKSLTKLPLIMKGEDLLAGKIKLSDR